MEAKREKSVVLVPGSAQGHLTPMMQLGKALQSKGLSIILVQTKHNYLSPSDDFDGFRFLTIPDHLPDSGFKDLGVVEFFLQLNEFCVADFKNLLDLLLREGDDICGVIYDEFMCFAEAAAKQLNLPSFILTTTNATTYLLRSVSGRVKVNDFLSPMKDPESQEKLIPGFEPLKFKEVPNSTFATVDRSLELFEASGNRKTSSAVIVNTASCIESSSLEQLRKEMQIPVYAVGPLHFTTSVSISLLEQDRSCIEWLNKQKPGSVLYISLGSLALMKIEELLEMAYGVADSEQPFLWVIRPGSIPGSEWKEGLPEDLHRRLLEKGYIVQWAPQKEVLAHSAVGGMWTHGGWNSTLESIGEGIPMICRPFSGDQKVNARFFDCVWRIGIYLEHKMERAVVERAVRRLMVEKDGKDMKTRILDLKEKLMASISKGGSSYDSLDQLANFIKTGSEKAGLQVNKH